MSEEVGEFPNLFIYVQQKRICFSPYNSNSHNRVLIGRQLQQTGPLKAVQGL